MAASYKDSASASWLSRVIGWVNGSGEAVAASASNPLPVTSAGPAAGTATATVKTQVASAASSTTILAANASRRSAIIVNTDPNTLRIKYGATASATSFTAVIPSGGYWEMPEPIYAGIIDGIWDVDGAGVAQVTELT